MPLARAVWRRVWCRKYLEMFVKRATFDKTYVRNNPDSELSLRKKMRRAELCARKFTESVWCLSRFLLRFYQIPCATTENLPQLGSNKMFFLLTGRPCQRKKNLQWSFSFLVATKRLMLGFYVAAVSEKDSTLKGMIAVEKFEPHTWIVTIVVRQ